MRGSAEDGPRNNPSNEPNTQERTEARRAREKRMKRESATGGRITVAVNRPAGSAVWSKEGGGSDQLRYTRLTVEEFEKLTVPRWHEANESSEP